MGSDNGNGMGRGMGEKRSENRDNLYRFLVDPMVVVMGKMGNKSKQKVAARRTLVCTTQYYCPVLPSTAQRRCGIQHPERHSNRIVDYLVS